jgi:hypothetical protein
VFQQVLEDVRNDFLEIKKTNLQIQSIDGQENETQISKQRIRKQQPRKDDI